MHAACSPDNPERRRQRRRVLARAIPTRSLDSSPRARYTVPTITGFTSLPEFNVAGASGQRAYAVIPVTIRRKGDERWYDARL